MADRQDESTKPSAPKGAVETYLEKIRLTPKERALLRNSERELLANRDKAIEQVASLVDFMKEREAVARRIIGLMEEGTVENFYNLPLVDGPTILELCVLLNESSIEKAKGLAAQMQSEQARAGARARLAKNPVQAAKPDAYKLWLDWQERRALHKSAAAFHRYVIDQLPIITDTKTVERWCREWKKNRDSAS